MEAYFSLQKLWLQKPHLFFSLLLFQIALSVIFDLHTINIQTGMVVLILVPYSYLAVTPLQDSELAENNSLFVRIMSCLLHSLSLLKMNRVFLSSIMSGDAGLGEENKNL